MRVHLVPPVIDVPRTAEVRSVRPVSGDSAIVSLAGVDDAHVADMLTGCHCLVATDDVDAARLEEAAPAGAPGLVGWTFEDRRSGLRGAVADVRQMPGQTLLAVTIADDGHGEHLVPFVDEFVAEADAGARHLVLDLPEGLFEL